MLHLGELMTDLQIFPYRTYLLRYRTFAVIIGRFSRSLHCEDGGCSSVPCSPSISFPLVSPRVRWSLLFFSAVFFTDFAYFCWDLVPFFHGSHAEHCPSLFFFSCFSYLKVCCIGCRTDLSLFFCLPPS